MNTVPSAHDIVSNRNVMGPLKLSTNALLLNIPGPIPLQWQLAVPTDVDANVDSSGFVPQRIAHMDSNITQTPSAQIKVNQPKNAPTLCVEGIIRTLQQFGRYNAYDSSSSMVIDGFIRNLESQISSTIPYDITNLCSTFYHEDESEYIHFMYKLYQILKHETAESFSGKTLVSIITHHNLVQNQEKEKEKQVKAEEVCAGLLKHDLIQILWYKTTFSSLFDIVQSEQAATFNASDDYVYRITDYIKTAFEAYTSSNTSSEN